MARTQQRRWSKEATCPSINSANAFYDREELRMDRVCQRMQAMDKGGCGCIEEFVSEAVNAAAVSGGGVLPMAVADDLLEGDAVSGTAPGGDDDLGVFFGDLFGCGLLAWGTEEGASGGFDEFDDPELRVDEGLAPFFAVNPDYLVI